MGARTTALTALIATRRQGAWSDGILKEYVQRDRLDRRDAALLRDTDSLHFIMGIIYPNRADNEAYIAERVNLGPIKDYIATKNYEGIPFKYTFFHVILTALVKTVTLRPKLNRFYANENYYQRNKVTAGFIIKKEFADGSEEAVALLEAKPDATIETIHDEIYQQVSACREKKKVNTTDNSMNILNKMPRFLSKALIHFIRFLDRHGWCPDFLVGKDPNYSSVFLSNLGSIRLKSGYHHLTNWGTNSIFVVVGERHLQPFFDDEGKAEMRPVIEIGLTLDERIADGYYYAKTVRLLKHLLTHPELLDTPAK